MEIYGAELIRKVFDEFKKKGIRLSVAESCTAGLVSHMLTSLPGSSAFFDSAVVAYSLDSKQKLLGLKKSLVKEHGLISEDVARAMAESLMDKTGADFALAVTGNLGPEAIGDTRVGLVYMAVSHKKGSTSRGFVFDGSREEIRHLASVAAIEFLYEAVSVWG